MHTTLLLLVLAAAAAAAPYTGTSQLCSTECPVAAAKLSLNRGKTYSYTYTGKSMVQLKDVDGGLVETKWEKQVLLTVLGPCDVAISFKDAKVDGETGPPGADKLERYPLVVAMTDGRVQRVCSHPDDDTWAINMKKGVASIMQISLPSLSNTNSGLNFTETDVVGTCPTYYEVEAEGAKVVVRKEKDHRLCQERYPTPEETPLPHLMGPLPIQESRSICRQEIESGTITSVMCEDKKVIRPSYGVYKFVEAKQESTLRLTSMDAPQPDTISRIPQGQMVPRSLRYDYETPKKDPSLVPQLEETLRCLCEITKDGVETGAAAQVSKAVHLMRRIPELGFKEVYAKVRSRKICPQHTKLQSLFFDAIAFVHEPESVLLMVKDLVEERATGTRAALYSAAFYLIPRPDVKTIEALEPLFRDENPHLLSAKLSASSMVNVYCRHNPSCYHESPVRNLAQAIKHKIENDLSPSSNEESQKLALSGFKSLGNMGVMTPEVAQVVLRYIQSENKKVNIRVAAAQAFRLAKCERSVTQEFVQYALRPGQNTEVRIASYLAAVPCTNYEDLQVIVKRISSEENTQVRGFILSHLLNLQQSDAPEKEGLRYLLMNIVIPRDFEGDLRKYSRNLDLSYFSPSLGLGAEVESNVIYAPGSFIPRSLGLNLSAALDGTGIPINIGEIGGRVEGLEPIIAQLFGPESYSRTSSYSKIFHDLIFLIQRKWSTIQQELLVTFEQGRSFDSALLKSIMNKLYDPHAGPVQADVFARLLGKEISYASLSKKLQDINTDDLLKASIQYLMQTLNSMKNMNLDSARAAQLDLDYSFPTIHGTPLKIAMEALVVTGIKMETSQAARGSYVKILPSLSIETHGFIGFDAYIAKSGLKMNTTVSSNNGVAIRVNSESGREKQIDVDIPDKMEIIHVQSETFLMKHKKDQPDTKVLPPPMQDTRIRSKSCLAAFESVFGLKLCYDINVPDIFQANSLPLGSPALATISINKTESSIKGYKAVITENIEGRTRKMNLKVIVVGSSSPKETDVEFAVTKEYRSRIIDIKLQSPTTHGGAKVSFIYDRAEYKSFQTDVFFTTNANEFSKSIKVDFKISSIGNGKKYEINMFSSPSRHISQDSRVFTAALVQNYGTHGIAVDILAKTEDSLMHYIPFNLEVGGDLSYYYQILLPSRLRKFELDTGILGWRIAAFFRETKESNNGDDYSSALQVVHEREEVIHVQADLSLQGTPAVDFKEQLFAKAKVGDVEYKMQQTMDYQETRMTVTLRLTRSSDNVNVIEIVVEKDSQKIEILLQAQPYGYLAPIKVAIGAVRKGEEYNTEALLMYGNHILVELSGPVSYIDTPSHTRLVANIKFNNMYHFGYISEFREGKEAVLLEIKRQEEILVYLQFINLNTMSPQRSLIEAKVNLPPLIDGEVNGFITEGVIHISTNTLLLPRSSAQRRIKAFTDISWDNKQGQVMVLWDADQDPSKKITVDAIIVPESGSPAQATMDVKIILLEKTYNVSMKVVAPFLLHQYRERNSISMEVKTPEQRKWMFEIGIQDEGSNSAIADLTLRTINNNNYHLTSDLRWKHLEGPFGLEVEAGIGYVSPQNTHGHFSLLAKHQRSPQRHIVQLTMEASTPSIQTPLKIDFCIDNQDYSYTTKLQSSMSSEAPMFQWQLETYPGGGVKHLEVISDMRAIRDVLKAVNRIVNSRGGPLMVNSVFENERRAYRWLYSRPSPDTHSIKFDFPSRSLEAEITYSPSKAGIKIYPNRAASEAKYEVSGEHIISSWGGTSQYVGRMSHPMLSRDMKVVVDMSLGGTSLHGSFQLDVFPDTADKVTGSLSFVHRANNTIVIVTNLSTRVLQVKPKVTVEASWAEHTAAFNFTFQETPSSPESLKVIAKYDRIYRDYAAVTFQLVTEGRPVVDVSGIVEPRQGLHCDGYALLSNVHTSDLGDFIVNSTVCRWAFLDLALNRQNDETIYKTKVGLLSPYKAEMSISETDTYQVRNKYLSLIGIELASPRRLKINFEYKPQKMTAMKDFMLEEGDRVMEATLSWTDRVCSEVERQAHQAGVPFPDPEIRALVEEAKNDILKILVDVLCNDLLREWDVVMQILNGPTATFITEVFYQTLLDMAHMQRELALHVSQQINKLKQLFRPAISEIIEAVVQAYQWVQTGEEPEMVRRLVNEVQRTNLYQIFQTHVIEPIKESYPHQYQATKEVVAKVIDSFRHDLIMLQQKVWASPTLRNTILKIIDLTQEDMLRETLEWCMSQVTQKILFVAPEPGTYHVGIQVPLYQPTYSLTQVANMMVQSPPSFTQKMLLSAEGLSPIPVTKIMEIYYVWMPAKLSSTISPFNRSALVVNDTEILTFDGASLRAPRSPCKVLLASVTGEASVYMSHSQTSEALEITFQTGPNKAIIKPNMEVDINGRTVHGRQTVGDLVIEVTPLYVTLVTPLMGVQRSKDNVVMVNVSSWTFNHTKGLLGSYDNERANDRMMSNGRNATSLRGLVASWQENPDCPTPPITPINPAQVPVKESVMCDFIFFQLRPCEPVVSPKPFIQRCLVDPRPFEVAHAYVSFCRMHGVKFPLSIF